MGVKARFYLKDVQEEYGQFGPKDTPLEFHRVLKVRTLKDVLFFYMEKESMGNAGVPPYVFDGKATAEHVKNYGNAYLEFKKAHPDFKLEWPELDVEVS